MPRSKWPYLRLRHNAWMVTSLSFSVLKTRGEEWFSHTIPFCFHHPCMTPRYPNTDSNMTCHSERAMPLGIAASLPTTQLREGAQQPSCLHALSSVHAGCKPSNPTLAHPQPKPLLSPGSTHSHSFTFFLYWLLIGYWFSESLLSQLYYFPIFAL